MAGEGGRKDRKEPDAAGPAETDPKLADLSDRVQGPEKTLRGLEKNRKGPVKSEKNRRRGRTSLAGS